MSVNFDDQYSMPLRMIFGLDKNIARHGGGAMGQSRGPDSTHVQSRPPKPWPRSGQTGDPNQASSMTASRMMQQISTNDDIKYWMGDPEDPEDTGATFNPPIKIPKYWDTPPAQLEGSIEYVYNMETLEELFNFGKKPMKMFQKLVVGRSDYQELAREALKTALVHKKFKEKIMNQGDRLNPSRIAMIEKNEDVALEILLPLKNKIDKNVEFLVIYFQRTVL